MQSLIVYVAGPYRADTIAGVRRNIERARAVAEELWAMGYPTICPHLNTAFMDGLAEDGDFLDGDLLILKRCDAVVLVDGYEDSIGAMAEVKCAAQRGLPIFANAFCVPDRPMPPSYLRRVGIL